MSKKLFRSEKDRVLGGVCGGLSEYLDIDVVVVRVFFVLITFFGGGGLFIYLILWIFLPTESSVGLSVEETTKENAEEIEETFKKIGKKIKKNQNSRIIEISVGVFLLLLGISFLFSNFGLPNIFGVVFRLWPIFIILVGFLIVFRGIKR